MILNLTKKLKVISMLLMHLLLDSLVVVYLNRMRLLDGMEPNGITMVT